MDIIEKDHYGYHRYGHFMKINMADIGIILKGGKSVYHERKLFVKGLFL